MTYSFLQFDDRVVWTDNSLNSKPQWKHETNQHFSDIKILMAPLIPHLYRFKIVEYPAI